MDIKIEYPNIFLNGQITKCVDTECQSRKIYKSKDYIIKIGVQSKTEYDRWVTFDELDKQFFAEILCFDKIKFPKMNDELYYVIQRNYIFMKKGKIYTEYKQLVDYFSKKYRILDLGYYNGISYNNWGITKLKQLKIFDYGI